VGADIVETFSRPTIFPASLSSSSSENADPRDFLFCLWTRKPWLKIKHGSSLARLHEPSSYIIAMQAISKPSRFHLDPAKWHGHYNDLPPFDLSSICQFYCRHTKSCRNWYCRWQNRTVNNRGVKTMTVVNCADSLIGICVPAFYDYELRTCKLTEKCFSENFNNFEIIYLAPLYTIFIIAVHFKVTIW